MFEFFFNLSISEQFLVVLFLSIAIILTFTIFFSSKELSIRHFFDPGSLSEAESKSHFTIALIETIAGIVIIGTLVSLLTNALIEVNEKRKSQKDHRILKEAFQTNTLVRTRALLNENNITAELRRLYIKEAEVRLEIGREEIIKTIRLNGNFRLRMLKTDHEIVIENFNANRDYGEYVDRNSDITIVGTQSYSDAGIGHYCQTIAKNLNANYISNEFYSPGAPLRERQLSFTWNDKYLTMDDSGDSPIDNFIKDIKILKDKTKLFVFIGASSATRKHDISVMFGGKKNTGFDVEHPTYNNIEKLKQEYSVMSDKVKEFKLLAGTHEEFDDTNKTQVTHAIHDNFKNQSITIYISTDILWSQDEKQYYEVMISLIDMIKKLS